MKTALPEKLTTEQDVTDLLTALHGNHEFYHLDDDAKDIISITTNERIFTDEEATKLNALMKQAFSICEPWELPIIETILSSLRDEKETENQEDIWLSVDGNDPITWDEFYKANTADGVDQLPSDIFMQIKRMKIGEKYEPGMGADVERVAAPTVKE